MLSHTLLLLALVPWTICDAYKILVYFPLFGKSHGILGEGVVKRLLEGGHEVTYITPFQPKISDKNLRTIFLDNAEKFMQQSGVDELLNINNLLNNNNSSTISMESMLYMMFLTSQNTIENEKVQKLLNDPNEKFDLVFIEWMFTEVPAGLSAVFDCPYVWFGTTEPHFLILHLIDEYLNPAYNVGSMSEQSIPLSFWGRINELREQLVTYIKKEFILYKYENEVYEKLFSPILAKRGRPLPPLNVIKYNASLALGNAHVSMGEATRLPQSFKPVGGYHIDTDVKPLPEDLKKIMDNAKYGVIYFSMGSNLKSKDWPLSIKRGLLDMFSRLKQTILWKFEETLPDLPSNVHILQWAPQHSILAHPNCVLFITHGGLLSTTEAIHFGVPIIGIPVFGDQFINVKRAVNKGIAEEVKFSNSLVEDLQVAIEKHLNNPRYTEKVKELSFIYHHRPISPGSELLHWVNHVVMTRGAPHLRSPALGMPLYQKMYLDLVALILGLLLALRFIIKHTFFSKTKKINQQKKNK